MSPNEKSMPSDVVTQLREQRSSDLADSIIIPAVLYSVSANEAKKQQSERHHDVLTGLPNRAFFQHRLTEAIRYAIEEEEMLAVLVLDIHRFKRINDAYGPRIGDECIKHLAGVLESQVSFIDTVARTGADEFAIILTSMTDIGIAVRFADTIRERFVEQLLIQGHRIQVSLHMGLAICPYDSTDAITLWRGAEVARRQAQIDGAEQIVQLSPELACASEERIEIENFIQTRSSTDGFDLMYQPLYALDGSVHSIEALLRLNHPRYGIVSPASFIPIAEEAGFICCLGEWVIQEVCQQLLFWRQQGIQIVPVAINVSCLQLMQPSFAERVMEILLLHEIDPQWIHLEVTETSAMRNIVGVSEQISALSEKGITFSIDDFGTGHSSLSRLHQLPVSILKIDRTFINQLCVRNGTYSIVKAIITMAHALNHLVVAEGVETEDQLARLRDLQCDAVQGYLLSPPVDAEHIPKLVANNHPVLTQSEPEKQTT
jgi:diguanylate cyclase (GGDEF)-like protein